jgi:arylsulfatase A-like enzyme
MPVPSTPQEYRPAYKHAIAEADRQFAEVMQILDDKGVLNNAIVVVLSDHGEALGFENDSMLRKVGTGDEIWNSLWGHGTSVMSPHQYSVLLAMRAYGRARLPGAVAAYSWPVSLEDLRPTLQQLATAEEPLAVDGLSLLPYLAGVRDPAELQQRIRFTETGFNTAMVMAGKYNESGLVREGAAYYELAGDSGWVQLRRDRLPELLAQKQRAALTSDWLLAAIPGVAEGPVRYLLADRRTPLPREIKVRPDPAAEPQAAQLWDALHARFPGELPDQP